ncbi:MAG: dockerin type I domain-containing protein [Oscillospiraceae bacterium]
MNLKKSTALLTSAIICMSMSNINAFAEKTSSELLDVSQFTILDENIVSIDAGHLNDVSVLFDEQDKVPESPDNTEVGKEVFEAANKNTNWKPNQQSEYGEDSFYIDLKANYVITGICYLDTNGINQWKVESGEPFSWNEILSFSTDTYMSWQGKNISDKTPTRYLRFSTGNGDSGVSELAIYGYKVSELSEEQLFKTSPKHSDITKTNLSAGGKVGFNAFIDDPMTSIYAAGNVREYHNLNWLIDDNGKIKFTQGTWGDMDNYYSAMKSQNIDIIPCFQGGSSYIYGDSDYPEIAVPKGADTLNPASYTIHAQAMYQVAARYGSNSSVDIKTLNAADSKEAVTGMGLLTALENCNEPNKNWSGKANYYTPYELAAMCSADYDGHEGTIPNAGVKNADKNFKLAMGGLVGYPSVTDYLTEMKLWFDYNRLDGKFAVDIINIHISPDDYNPEDSNFAKNIQSIQKWIDENAPDTELWVSEYEIPMGDCITEGVDNHNNENYQLKYAQRIIRTNLIALKEGADRITKFQLRDEAGGAYADSGIVTQKGKWDKKKAWYYLSCMTSVLENADFYEDLSADGISVYRFKDSITGEFIDCIWSPTNEDKVIKNVSFSAEDADYIYLTEPSEFAEGTEKNLKIADGRFSIDVTETPVYITYSDYKKAIVNGKDYYIRPSSICLSENNDTEICDLTAEPSDKILNQFYRMFDESETMPKYIYGDTSGLSSSETNVTESDITCYVDLENYYHITGFGIYDTFGTGKFSVYDADTDVLLWSSDMGGYMSRTIDMIADSTPTNKLKIVKGGGDLNEFAIYGYAVSENIIDGDVNNDGKFNIMDILLLKKWLLNVPNTTLADKNAGDLCSDGKLDVFDLCCMKNMLISQ